MDGLIVPDVLGELEAWRAFNLNGKTLFSHATTYAWTPGVNEASCDKAEPKKTWKNGPNGDLVEIFISSHGPIPSSSCGCGFWAYKDIMKFQKKLHMNLKDMEKIRGKAQNPYAGGHYGDFGSPESSYAIAAKVKLWGRVIEGADGYRSEFAQVVGLIQCGVPDKLIQAVSEIYRAIILPYEEQVPPPLTKTGNILAISPPEPRKSSRKNAPPRIIHFSDGNVFTCWENSDAFFALVEAYHQGNSVAIVYEEQVYYGTKSFMIIEAVNLGSVKKS